MPGQKLCVLADFPDGSFKFPLVLVDESHPLLLLLAAAALSPIVRTGITGFTLLRSLLFEFLLPPIRQSHLLTQQIMPSKTLATRPPLLLPAERRDRSLRSMTSRFSTLASSHQHLPLEPPCTTRTTILPLQWSTADFA